MPTLNIDTNEKKALRKYMNDPLKFVDTQYAAHFPNQACVSETKITRADSEHGSGRYFIVPIDSEGNNVIIPLARTYSNDPQKHTCTFIQGKLFFHQNAHDLPIINLSASNRVEDLDSDLSDDDGDEEKTAFHQQYREMMARLNAARMNRFQTKNYHKNECDHLLIKRVVKLAVDENDEEYLLHSTSSFNEEFIKPSSVILANHFRFYRNQSIDGSMRKKLIEIQPRYGETLCDFIDQEIPAQIIDDIAHNLIQEYINQIFNRGIVHTDINATNICIKEMVITYIDFKESFFIDALPTGKGTPGYYAPEFFKEPTDHLRQLDIRAEGEEQLINALKPNFHAFFSPATDIYALGTTLIQALQLSKASPYYELAVMMTDADPVKRPASVDLQQIFDTLLARNHIRVCGK